MTGVQLCPITGSHKHGRDGKTGEEGYALLVAIFLMALLVLGLGVAAPMIRKDLQREREREAIRRGNQYRRAIQLYYRKFHAYPPNVEALEDTDDIRFLRKRYIDPITGKDDWVPIQFGQNKVPTSFGFFGQEITATSIAGTGPGTGTPPSSSNQNLNSDDQSSNSDQGSGTPQGPGQFSSAIIASSGIIGFSIPSDKSSLVVYKKQGRYSLWEFVYDPLQDSFADRAAQSAYGSNPGTQGSPGSGSAVGSSPIGSSPVGSSPPLIGGPAGSGPPGSSTWSPNGNLPAPGGGSPTSGPWSPNGNLPAPQ